MSKFICFLFLSFMTNFLYAQLTINYNYTIDQMVDSLLIGSGVRTGNVKVKGDSLGIAYFEIDSTTIGANAGIIIATGNPRNAIGPNNTPGKSGSFPQKKSNPSIKRINRRGDRELNKICTGRVREAVILEFDFIASNNLVQFEYCFGSEEYLDYVNSRFNDVFAFIVNGPSLKKQNVAVLADDKNTAVTINNINHKKNQDFFVDNDPFINYGMSKSDNNHPRLSIWQWIKMLFKKKSNNGFSIDKRKMDKLSKKRLDDFQYDGFTVQLTAAFHVIPYKKYHIKIAIGDAGDQVFDSGVFLEAGSLRSVKNKSAPGFVDYQTQENFNYDSAFWVKPPVIYQKSIINPESTTNENPFEVTTVYFKPDAHALEDNFIDALDSLSEYLLDNPTVKCNLFGYTDTDGSTKYNRKLSEKRVKAVRVFLIESGIDSSRMNSTGLSEIDPEGDNSTEAGKAKNRRVEIVLIK